MSMSWKDLRILLLFAVLMTGASFGQAKPPGVPIEIVPIEQEPSHNLVFENEYVRVFSVEVPPHAETRYHRHERDSVGVVLGDSDVESVRVGEAPAKLLRKDGEAQFTKGGFEHKVVNKSDKPFRNVTVELKKGAGDPNHSLESVAVASNRIVVDASNVSCWRIVKAYSADGHSIVEAELKPGFSYLLISAGETPVGMELTTNQTRLHTGDIKWIDPKKNIQVQALPPGGGSLCRFVTQGPSRQKQGARDDKASGASKK
jgi:hypothetical protein